MVDDHGGLRDPRARLLEICLGLPEVTVSGDRQVAFEVGKRRFAYYLDDHHGDGRLALNCKVPPGDMEALVALDPRRFFVPAYLGAKGWIGVRLDQEDVDWEEVARFVAVSYRLVAPRRLAVRAL
jgi:predicted DNA-binding protein (MmcQ/YjbR family)